MIPDARLADLLAGHGEREAIAMVSEGMCPHCHVDLFVVGSHGWCGYCDLGWAAKRMPSGSVILDTRFEP